MLIYNTTYNVTNKSYASWIIWLKETHVPFMQKSGDFFEPQITKLIYSENQDAASYAVQFKVKDIETLNKWKDWYEELLNNEIKKTFGEEVLTFSTVMEVIE